MEKNGYQTQVWISKIADDEELRPAGGAGGGTSAGKENKMIKQGADVLKGLIGF